MLYKYSVILDINSMVETCNAVKYELDKKALEFSSINSSIEELSNKEKLRYYISRSNIKDRDRILELIDKL